MSDPYTTPEGQLENTLVYCRDCGTKISKSAVSCPSCGAQQNLAAKSKVAAGLLAIFLGGFGVHRFYLGQWWGLFYLLFFWTWIPSLISLVEGIVFLASNEQNWNAKYGNVKGSSALVLIVIVFFTIFIIGILAAIAIPAYNGYVEKAREAQIEAQK
ncbi:Type IV pilin PilA [hydrothermal vent metagenome]|uniref:Type IV pilin PilA n=1 Tax=hydrothermal vent metagenome TaxID=652676 RepID=A0A3B0XEE2_9ZZZZ